MNTVRVSIQNRSLWESDASALFINHLAGNVWHYERELDARLSGRLVAAYRDREYLDYTIVETQSALATPVLCIVNFQRTELPFDYASVDKYARQIIRILHEESVFNNCRSIGTRLFGRLGLDVGESLETMISAFASEIRLRGKPATLQELQFMEHDGRIVERLQQRLTQLLRDGTILQGFGEEIRLNLSQSDATLVRDENRFEGLARRPVFVAMPFAKEFDNIYFFGIKGPVEAHGRKCERLDQEIFIGDIITRIKNRIAACEIVIGDLTGQNANVFYEIGYAEGLGKPVLLISQDDKTSFDLQTQWRIRYEPLDLLGLVTALNKSLDKLLAETESANTASDSLG